MSKSISRRGFLKTSGMLAVAGALAACAPQAAPQAGSQAGASSGGAEKIQLKWDTFRGPGTGWNEERIKTFEATNPNVSIEFRPLGGASQQDNYGKMYAEFAAGDLGDIIAFDPSHFHFWRAINKKIIMPIDDLVSSDNLDLKQWYDQFMALQYYQGKLYGLPSWGWAGFDTLVTNQVHFDAEGVTLPDPTAHDTPIDTIAEWAHKFYKEGERYGLSVTYSEAGLTVLCRVFNSYLIDEEGKKCLILDDQNAQDSLKWLYQLAVGDKVLPAPGSVEDLPAAQLEGRITMNWAGSLNVRNFKRDLKDDKVGKAWQVLLPTRKDGKFPSQIRGGTWNILLGTKHPQEAFQFIKHITNTDGCYSFNLVAGQGAFVRPDVMQKLIEQDPVHKWFLPNLENGIPARAPANSRGREYTDAVQQWATILMDSKQPVPFEKGLQDLYDNIQKVLDLEPA